MSTTHARRFNYARTDGHWSEAAAASVLASHPDNELYTCAAGISPSGIVHFGNFRDVITTFMVANALREQGKNVRFIFSWDDFDRFRKVPQGIDPSFSRYIGMPLSAVPDPHGELPSYARRFELEFENSMRELGMELEYRCQTQEYQSGRYDDQILHCLRHRRRIAEILLSFMSDKGKAQKGINPEEYTASFWPISVYSRFTGKDRTTVLSFDEQSGVLTYRCDETGNTESVDLRIDRIAKLSWKVDWPMRWAAENVIFEPGGHDHAAPGGSYDVASAIAGEIFQREPPLFVGYQFIGLQGLDGKMSGSSGMAVSPARLLEIYEPALLKWLYARKGPDQGFSLAFDSEIFRQYDEFDREAALRLKDELEPVRRASFDIAVAGTERSCRPIPFRQAVAFGQIVRWDAEKVTRVSSDLGLQYDLGNVQIRLEKARAWLETYNSGEMLKLNESVNRSYAQTMSPQALAYVRQLRAELLSGPAHGVAELEVLVYSIPKDPTLEQKENSVRQRAFFKDVYNLLIGSGTGPRLSTFVWAVDRAVVLSLLDV